MSLFELSRLRWALCALLSLHAGALFAADGKKVIQIAEVKRDKPVDFEKDVLPILRKNCVACHNTTQAEGKLVLESPQSILKGGDSGPSAIAKDGLKSLLLQRATGEVDDIMPPKDNKVAAKPLTPQELGLIKLWIDQGATGTVTRTAEAIQWQPLPPGVNPIYAVALSSDGQYAAAARANQVFLYQALTGRVIGRLTDPDLVKQGIYKQPGVADLDLIQSLAFSPDGATLATGGYRNVKLWQRPRNLQESKIANVGDTGRAMAVSADGKWVAVGSADGAVKVFERAGGKLHKTLTGHTGAVASVKFTADGKLYSASADKTVRGWQLPGGEAAGQIEAPFPIETFAVIDGGKQVVVAGAEPKALVLNMAEPMKPAIELPALGKKAVAMEPIASNPTQVIIGVEDGTVTIFDAPAKRQVRQIKHDGPLASLAVRADGTRLVTAGKDKRARLFNLADGKALSELRGDLRRTTVVAQKDRLVVLAKADVAYEKTVVTEAEKAVTTEAEGVKKATDSLEAAKKTAKEKTDAVKKPADDKAAAEKAVKDAEPAVKTADAAKEKAAKALTDAEAAAKAATDKFQAAKAAADKEKDKKELADARDKADKEAKDAAEKLKTAQQDKAKADTAATQAADQLKKAQGELPAKEKAFADADKIRTDAETARMSAERALTASQAASKKATERVPQTKASAAAAEERQKKAEADLDVAKKASADAESPLTAVAFSPDGLEVAFASEDKLIHLFSAETGAAFEVLEGQAAAVTALAFADDKTLVAAGADKNLTLWSTLPEWKLARTLGPSNGQEFADRVTALAFSNDGKMLAAGGGAPSRGGELKIFNVADGKLVRDLAEAHSDTVFGIEFSFDGKYLASGAADKFVKVFEVATGKFVKSFEGHTHHVLGVSWMSDSRTLASCGADNVIKVWDFVSGDQKRTIQGFTKEVTSIHFAGDSVNAIASAGDKSVKLQRVDNGGAVRSYAGGTDFMYGSAITPDGKVVIAGGQDSVLRVWNGETGTAIRQFDPPASAPAQSSAESAKR